MKGSKNSNAILSESQVVEIIARLNKGGNRRKIAEEFGVSLSAIKAIRAGTNWKHLAQVQRELAEL